MRDCFEILDISMEKRSTCKLANLPSTQIFSLTFPLHKTELMTLCTPSGDDLSSIKEELKQKWFASHPELQQLVRKSEAIYKEIFLYSHDIKTTCRQSELWQLWILAFMQMIPDKHYCKQSKPTMLQAHLDATGPQIGQCHGMVVG